MIFSLKGTSQFTRNVSINLWHCPRWVYLKQVCCLSVWDLARHFPGVRIKLFQLLRDLLSNVRICDSSIANPPFHGIQISWERITVRVKLSITLMIWCENTRADGITENLAHWLDWRWQLSRLRRKKCFIHELLSQLLRLVFRWWQKKSGMYS